MNRYQKLEQITNGINAAYKIKNARDSLNRKGPEERQETSNVELLMQMLSVIAQYSPEPHRNSLSDRLERTTVYQDTYKNLKQHLKNLQSNRQVDSEGIVKTLEIVKPIVDKDKRSLIEKVLQIHEILKS
ncbi:hypothetical protein [Acetivibrio cellulolyticus]|uniref:hypothetical protein n=1 Tax=Acetivibrio cellulolyticus TaxID=35830 RepID=UPI0001E2E748|nr:hypothetical protein [Acetivibrio cellulolyticus]